MQSPSGNLVCWGNDGRGQVSGVPDSVNGVEGGASAIAAGDSHSLAVQAVPEPGAVAGLGAALGTLALLTLRRRITRRRPD